MASSSVSGLLLIASMPETLSQRRRCVKYIIAILISDQRSDVRPLCYLAGMPRIARTIVPGLAHHLTQRGNRRQRTFFTESDYADYITFMAESCRRCEVEIWA